MTCLTEIVNYNNIVINFHIIFTIYVHPRALIGKVLGERGKQKFQNVNLPK